MGKEIICFTKLPQDKREDTHLHIKKGTSSMCSVWQCWTVKISYNILYQSVPFMFQLYKKKSPFFPDFCLSQFSDQLPSSVRSKTKSNLNRWRTPWTVEHKSFWFAKSVIPFIISDDYSGKITKLTALSILPWTYTINMGKRILNVSVNLCTPQCHWLVTHITTWSIRDEVSKEA